MITCNFLQGLSDKEILTNLKESDQNVKEVKRIVSMRDGTKKGYRYFHFDFLWQYSTEKLYVGMQRFSVRQYIPNPRQCYKCFKFRHTKHFCKQKETVCGNCGQAGHDRDECDENPHCVNCEGDHSSSSRACPFWKQEKRIVELKFKENITFPEAIKKVENESKAITSTSITYSAVVSSKLTCSIRTQTDLTWPNGFTSPILTSACLISNDKSCQSESENVMQFENGSAKRSRGESSSSLDGDGMPNISSIPPSKRIINKSNTGPTTGQPALPPSGGGATSGVGGGVEGSDGQLLKRSPESEPASPSPPPRPSRSGSTGSGGRRGRSPIKPP